jgi:hypothetical protein
MGRSIALRRKKWEQEMCITTVPNASSSRRRMCDAALARPLLFSFSFQRDAWIRWRTSSTPSTVSVFTLRWSGSSKVVSRARSQSFSPPACPPPLVVPPPPWMEDPDWWDDAAC